MTIPKNLQKVLDQQENTDEAMSKIIPLEYLAYTSLYFYSWSNNPSEKKKMEEKQKKAEPYRGIHNELAEIAGDIAHSITGFSHSSDIIDGYGDGELKQFLNDPDGDYDYGDYEDEIKPNFQNKVMSQFQDVEYEKIIEMGSYQNLKNHLEEKGEFSLLKDEILVHVIKNSQAFKKFAKMYIVHYTG